MRDAMWELFVRTGLPQVYNYYAQCRRRDGHVSNRERTDSPQREL